MKKLIIAMAINSVLLAPAFAQTSQSTATAASGSQSSVVHNNSVPAKQRIESTVAAVAPGLTAAGVHSCAGSTSVGVGGTGFGFGFGSTREMKECSRRAYAASLMGLGQNAAALELLCKNAEVRNALNVSGMACPSQRRQPAATTTAARSTATAPSSNRRLSRSALGLSPADLRAKGCRLDAANTQWTCPPGTTF